MRRGVDLPIFRHVLGPFDLLSELELTRLPRAMEQRRGRVINIRLSGVASTLAGGVKLSAFLAVAPGRYLIDIPGVARFLICDGSEVTVDLHPGANLGDVQGYLTAWVLGALCHQNSLLPLHASAVSFGSRVTAFVADSGSGKSTLAAALGQRGQTVVADDICLLDFPGDTARPVMLPLAPWLKLHREAAAVLGQTFQEADRTFSDEDKFRVPLQGLEAAPDESLYVANIVFLSRDPAVMQPALTRLYGAPALGRLLEKVYLAHIVEAAGLELRLFKQCAAVLRHASVHQLTIPEGLDRLGEAMDLLDPLLRG